MRREIFAYSISHEQNDGYFLVREKGKPDRRVAESSGMTLFESAKAIAASYQADSLHVYLTNDPASKPQIECFAFLPLDETKKVNFPAPN